MAFYTCLFALLVVVSSSVLWEEPSHSLHHRTFMSHFSNEKRHLLEEMYPIGRSFEVTGIPHADSTRDLVLKRTNPYENPSDMDPNLMIFVGYASDDDLSTVVLSSALRNEQTNILEGMIHFTEENDNHLLIHGNAEGIKITSSPNSTGFHNMTRTMGAKVKRQVAGSNGITSWDGKIYNIRIAVAVQDTTKLTSSYMATVITVVSQIYQRDLFVTATLVYLGNTFTSMNALGSSTRAGKDWDAAFWGTVPYSGGFGWSTGPSLCVNPGGMVCTAGLAAAYGTTAFNAIHDPYIIAHEVGHLIGGPHTHDQDWFGPTASTLIDCCGSSNSPDSCLPADGGTIMSYCVTKSKSYGGLVLMMGQVGAHGLDSHRINIKIRNTIELITAQKPSCLQFTMPDPNWVKGPPQVAWPTPDTNTIYTVDTGAMGAWMMMNWGSDLTRQSCIDYCTKNGPALQQIATATGSSCWCFEVPSASFKKVVGATPKPCPGNPSTTCGGTGANQFQFIRGTAVTPYTSPLPGTSPQPPTPKPVPTPTPVPVPKPTPTPVPVPTPTPVPVPKPTPTPVPVPKPTPTPVPVPVPVRVPVQPTPTPISGPTDCFSSTIGQPQIFYFTWTWQGSMTPDVCLSLCAPPWVNETQPNVYITGGGNCYCFRDNDLRFMNFQPAPGQCTAPCNGDPSLLCGGTQYQIYTRIKGGVAAGSTAASNSADTVSETSDDPSGSSGSGSASSGTSSVAIAALVIACVGTALVLLVLVVVMTRRV